MIANLTGPLSFGLHEMSRVKVRASTPRARPVVAPRLGVVKTPYTVHLMVHMQDSFRRPGTAEEVKNDQPAICRAQKLLEVAQRLPTLLKLPKLMLQKGVPTRQHAGPANHASDAAFVDAPTGRSIVTGIVADAAGRPAQAPWPALQRP